MVKKSDMSKIPPPPEPVVIEEPEVVEEKVEEPREMTVVVQTPAPDMTPVVEAVKEMAAASNKEPKVVQIEKNRKLINCEVTVTKRDYRGMIEKFIMKEITNG